ncbi:MAG: DUF512 domain-containing protein [Anaerolineae bacterium]|nr:DUF512 domain-containing protein [Anaerolineae bacterium]
MPASVISEVTPGSLADRIGLLPGDELSSVNEMELRDIIDLQFYAADEYLTFGVFRAGEELILEAERRFGEPLGLSFGEPTFDGIRRCANQCEFCFVEQMPRGLRRTLYVKDDDYRHSFLNGSYITLTNLTEADWERIEEQYLSPLYVSVHTTDLELRRRLLGNPGAPDVLSQLERLVAVGVEVHTQAVLIPGVNDGEFLDRSIRDLVALQPGVRSLSVVPVGLTQFQRGDCRVYTDAEMRRVFDLVLAWQERLSTEFGAKFVYLSDEWYLRLGEPVPPAADYDGLDLIENGVGLVRQYLASDVWRTRLAPGAGESLTVVTGSLFAPLMRKSLASSRRVDVVVVINEFFGQTVTVAGLLTGQDVVDQLRGRELGDKIALPPAMFGGPQGQSLDEMMPEDVSQALGRPVVLVEV